MKIIVITGASDGIGRYLAVDLTSHEIARIHDHGHTCFGMKPLPECSAAIMTLTPTRRERDPALATPEKGARFFAAVVAFSHVHRPWRP